MIPHPSPDLRTGYVICIPRCIDTEMGVCQAAEELRCRPFANDGEVDSGPRPPETRRFVRGRGL
jgi:hypothetical protein